MDVRVILIFLNLIIWILLLFIGLLSWNLSLNLRTSQRLNSCGKRVLFQMRTVNKNIFLFNIQQHFYTYLINVFILQDKVHDFSRLNNKDLLDSTIDAVGDTGLKVLFYLINYILIISTLILLVAMLLYNSKCPSVRLRQKA